MPNKERTFIAYWDCLGFESIVDITGYENKKLLADIKGERFEHPLNLHAIMLRAQFNPQRSPEIWLFTTTGEITQQDLIQIAQDTPQYLVDLIREKGNCLFRSTPQKQVIV
jgi:hypothetical protein